jgi:nicotinate phosphoribosyltransferase
MKKRLSSNVFDCRVQELRRGYRSDIYFWREKIVLEQHNMHPDVTTQVFQKRDAVLCGMDEAIAILKVGSGRYRDYKKAYKLFDRLMELKKEERSHYLTDKEKYLRVMEQKVDLGRTDSLWKRL